jgi:hypothetical protein
MFVDIVKFVCSSEELVHKMWRLQFYRFLQWFISGGCQVYGMVANAVLKWTGWVSLKWLCVTSSC